VSIATRKLNTSLKSLIVQLSFWGGGRVFKKVGKH
jgi:hypothetical protein